MTTSLTSLLQDALGPDYRIEQELPAGGMSRLFLASELRHNRRVVVKVLAPELASDASVARFRREIDLTVRLQHPHILPVLTSGVWEDVRYYITPFIAGESLRERIARENRLPLDDVIRILSEASDALAFAHARGVVHRDIKPGNILLAEGHAVLGDFGIARPMNTSATPLTGSGMTPGTPAYMAPDLPTDESADVYALGVVAYEMMCGALPRRGVSVKEIVAARGVVPDDSRGRVRALASVIAAAASTAPETRLRSTRELVEAVAQLSRRPIERRALVAGAAGVLLAAAVILSLVAERARRRPLNASAYVVVATGSSGAMRRDAAERMRTALGEWRGVTLVDAESGDARGIESTPALRDARAVARSLGARNLVFVDAARDANDLSVRATLYDASADSVVHEARASYGVSAPSAARRLAFRVLANHLLRDGNDLPWTTNGDTLAPTLSAWRAYDGARAAVTAWNLAGAAHQLRDALRADSTMSGAHLLLAQVLAWHDTSRRAEQAAEAAWVLQHHRGLPVRDSVRAVALLDLANGQFPDACRGFGTLVARDSTDYGAWLGLGDCQAWDRAVLRSATTPTSWAFRSSYESAAHAYRRAVVAMGPLTGPAAYGWIFGRLSAVLYPTTGRVRTGSTTGADAMGAFPYLDHDTLAFAPHPMRDFEMRRGDPMPARVQAAAARDRQVLLGVVEQWVQSAPRDAAALDSLAAWSELAGGSVELGGERLSTLELLHRARSVARDSLAQLRMAVAEVRGLLKTGAFVAAAAEADSLMRAGAAAHNRDAPGIPGVTALLGRVGQTVGLLPSAYGGQATQLQNGRVWIAPAAINEPATALLAYAAFGGPPDSVREQARRTLALIATLVPDSALAAQVRAALVARPLALVAGGFRAVAGFHPDPPDEVARTVFLAESGDVLGARRQLAALDLMERGKAAGYGVSPAFQLATAQLALGDTAGARRRLDDIATMLSALDPAFFDRVTTVTALVRALALRAELASRAGDRAAAAQSAAAVIALWAGGDASMQPLVSRMRAIASASR